MALNPRLVKDTQGVWWLEHDQCQSCGGYSYTTPGGVSRTFDPAFLRHKIGKPTEPFKVTVAPLSVAQGTVETVSQPPVVPPSGWVIEPPRSPVTIIPASSGVAINVTTRKDIHDIETTSSRDSAVLFQLNAAGSTLRRVVLRGIAEPTQIDSRGVHGVYAKARDVTIEDARAAVGPQGESGFSLRYDGAVLRRFDVTGSPPHPVTYYETSKVAGVVLIEQGNGTYSNGQTAMWFALDSEPRILQSFVVRDVHMRGPAGAKFMRFDPGKMDGSVIVEGSTCTLNGKPVTKADIENAPRLTVS